jgi:hypothetical protein
MKKLKILTSILISTFSFGQQNNETNLLELNQEIKDLKISRNEEQNFSLNLKKDTYYSIVASQQGIDLVVTLKDKNGKTIESVDTPNGMFGPEKIVFSPDSSEMFSISIKPLDEKANSQSGKYSVIYNEISKTLKNLSSKELIQDFDILQNAYYETKVGLWYNSKFQFDSICNVQKSKITDNMNALDFYKILAPIVAYTKEGHCNIKTSDEIRTYLNQNGTFFPFCVKILDKKVYILNDLENYKTKGLQLTKINDESINVILDKFLSIEPADGFNITSKYRWIEEAFSKYYARYFEPVKSFKLELVNPKNKEKVVYDIPSYNFKDYIKLYPKIVETIPNYNYKDASSISFDMTSSTAILTVNSFALDSYKDKRNGFKTFLENTFKEISIKKIKHLIIDIRKNEGGEQGMEDHLLSYLIDKKYAKYKYVEIPSFTCSFLEYTDYKNQDAILMKELKEDFYETIDGKIINKKGHYEGDKPHKYNFKGDVFVLISGLTFSGGSEFASLAKNYTNAKFIGEETGGGYYGNTSGNFLKLTLPNTKITAGIPICKFVVATNKNETPFGRGLFPDYNVQPTIEEYLNGFDIEMEYTKKLISK